VCGSRQAYEQMHGKRGSGGLAREDG
jgi:hypothetical protein